MKKCYGCLFLGEYQDMGASTPVCTREAEFLDAIKAVGEPAPCCWHITKQQVKALQDGRTAVNSGMSVNSATKALAKLADSLKALAERQSNA